MVHQIKSLNIEQMLDLEWPVASLDTETTGADFQHGCRPFYISTCTEANVQRGWHSDVDPYTRIPHIALESRHKDKARADKYERYRAEIQEFVDTHYILMHNAKFDVRALASIGVKTRWDRILDTLTMSHVWNSLTDHGLKHLGKAINLDDDDEKAVQVAVNKCRHIARKHKWRIAEPGDPHFPGWKPRKDEGKWKLDMWLPSTIHRMQHDGKIHTGLDQDTLAHYATVLQRYGMYDAIRTVLIGKQLVRTLLTSPIEGDGDTTQWNLYKIRYENLEHTYDMESHGITYHVKTLSDSITSVTDTVNQYESQCYKLADDKIDNLNSRQQLQALLFTEWKLPPTPMTKGGGRSTRAEDLLKLQGKLPPKSKQYGFLSRYMRMAKFDTGLTYLNSYRAHSHSTGSDDYRLIHGNILTTGTKTTRAAGRNPNTQNVSKQEDFNLRRVFQPLPGYTWYSIDYANIELRILAYASDETELIKAFERGESVHMLFAHIVCPEKIQAAGGDEAFKETLQYRRVKNGDFSLTYGAAEATADATYGIPGAYRKVRGYFTKLSKFMDTKIREAKRLGYITCIGGYKLYTPPGREYTTALDYFCQGTAGWCMNLSINRGGRYLKQHDGCHQILTIHDELVVETPDHQTNPFYEAELIPNYARLMELAGRDIGIPTPVECKRHTSNWADGETLKLVS